MTYDPPPPFGEFRINDGPLIKFWLIDINDEAYDYLRPFDSSLDYYKIVVRDDEGRLVKYGIECDLIVIGMLMGARNVQTAKWKL